MKRPNRFGCDWTADEDARLRTMWLEEYGLRSIATSIGRSRRACWRRAQQLGLSHGVPQGCVCLRDAAASAGYARETLKRILRAEGVTIHKWRGRRASAAYRFMYVDRGELEEALARHHARRTATESIREGALRVGVAHTTLRGWLARAGLLPPPRPHRGGPGIMVAVADVDRVVAEMHGRARSLPAQPERGAVMQ